MKEAEAISDAPQVVLLDINLQDGSGYTLCRQMREKFPQTKIFFLSARQEDFDVLKGYSVGGDDYIVKPASLPVLLAKVKKTLEKKNLVEVFRTLTIDKDAYHVEKNGVEIPLKNMEFKLFYYLYSNRGKVLQKEEIIREVWGSGYYSDNTLNVHINRLREKLEETPSEFIVTIWGVGYRFNE